MGTVGDKYTLTMKAAGNSGAAIDNPYINVFAYEAVSGTPTAAKLVDAFIQNVIPDLAPIISAGTEIFQLEVVNLDDLTDFVIEPTSFTGDAPGQTMPNFVVWEFEFLRGVRGVHNGRKAIGEVAEDAVEDGEATSSALPYLADAADAMAATIQDALTTAGFTPRIWRRAGNYGSPPVAFPDTFYPINGVAYRRVSTQNTRKR